MLIGQNNAGKSILIRCLNLIQNGALTRQDLRIGAELGSIDIAVSDPMRTLRNIGLDATEANLQFRLPSNSNAVSREALFTGGNRASIGSYPQREPNNAIYPFLAKRKVMTYDEVVNEPKANEVLENFTYLVAKVDRLTTPSHQLFEEFRNSCRNIIGFEIDSVTSPGGHRVGFPVGRTGSITLDTMGEGVPHLLALIADLCIADDKIFLLEEPENDLHPRALKSLLGLIIDKSTRNQFIVTTHSNIVARYLGSVDGAKTFLVQLRFENQIPTSDYLAVPEEPEARREVLEELGYEMTDYDLWDAWLVLEESSAERLLKEFFIPAFTPGLNGRLRTVAAGGIDGVEAKFDDFNRLFLFTHLTPSYRNRAWVVVDSGARGIEVVAELSRRYVPGGWTPNHFRVLGRQDFEQYYPPAFAADAAAALAIKDKRQRHAAKTSLLYGVLEWIAADRNRAIEEFSKSAQEIVDLLREIEEALSSPIQRAEAPGSEVAERGI